MPHDVFFLLAQFIDHQQAVMPDLRVDQTWPGMCDWGMCPQFLRFRETLSLTS